MKVYKGKKTGSFLSREGIGGKQLNNSNKKIKKYKIQTNQNQKTKSQYRINNQLNHLEILLLLHNPFLHLQKKQLELMVYSLHLHFYESITLSL